ncbi:MAG: hypothetical protein QNK37_09210 [Acidobacteriota bacterium]|nr:hypothetical protein [Acidobacteriota bacterium]
MKGSILITICLSVISAALWAGDSVAVEEFTIGKRNARGTQIKVVWSGETDTTDQYFIFGHEVGQAACLVDSLPWNRVDTKLLSAEQQWHKRGEFNDLHALTAPGSIGSDNTNYVVYLGRIGEDADFDVIGLARGKEYHFHLFPSLWPDPANLPMAALKPAAKMLSVLDLPRWEPASIPVQTLPAISRARVWEDDWPVCLVAQTPELKPMQRTIAQTPVEPVKPVPVQVAETVPPAPVEETPLPLWVLIPILLVGLPAAAFLFEGTPELPFERILGLRMKTSLDLGRQGIQHADSESLLALPRFQFKLTRDTGRQMVSAARLIDRRAAGLQMPGLHLHIVPDAGRRVVSTTRSIRQRDERAATSTTSTSTGSLFRLPGLRCRIVPDHGRQTVTTPGSLRAADKSTVPWGSLLPMPGLKCRIVADHGQQTVSLEHIIGNHDDLKLIEGIGPVITRLLYKNRIRTFADLAAADVAALRRMLDRLHLYMIDPTTWPEQAALARDGRMDDLISLQEELFAGRRIVLRSAS